MREMFARCDSCRRAIETTEAGPLAALAFKIEEVPDMRGGGACLLLGFPKSVDPVVYVNEDDLEQIYPELEVGKEYRVCYVCVLKTFGIKFKGGNG